VSKNGIIGRSIVELNSEGFRKIEEVIVVAVGINRAG